MENFGNHLNHLIDRGRSLLFNQGELAELTYGAFGIALAALDNSPDETIEISFPVGWRPDNQPILSRRLYKKGELRGRYEFLAFGQLARNGLIQIVTIVEAILTDVVRAVVLKHPQKLGAKRSVPLQIVLEASSLEDIHIRATDAFVHDLSYKSPAEYAECVEKIIPVNLFGCPAFHRYVEVKATRDIFIHNGGVANEIYERKAASHAPVKAGVHLPVDLNYFMHSYEVCLQVTEWLEKQLHEHWYSSEFENRQRQYNLPFPGHGSPVQGMPDSVPVGTSCRQT